MRIARGFESICILGLISEVAVVAVAYRICYRYIGATNLIQTLYHMGDGDVENREMERQEGRTIKGRSIQKTSVAK